MRSDAAQVSHQVLRYLIDQLVLVVGVLFQHLLQLSDQFLGRLGEVLYEVEGVTNLVGHSGGEFTERR